MYDRADPLGLVVVVVWFTLTALFAYGLVHGIMFIIGTVI